MSDAIIITPGIGDAAVSVLDATREERDDLLALAVDVKAVYDRLDADDAIATLRQLNGFVSRIDGYHKSAKAPVLTLSRQIDGLAKDLTQQIEAEANRISRVVGEFEAEERRKAEDERSKAAAEAARIAEETRQKAIAAAKAAKSDLAAARAVDEVVAEGAAKVAEVKQQAAQLSIPKPTGSKLRGNVCFEVEDIGSLLASNPELVQLSPNSAAIKAVIKANPNIQLPGVRHWIENKFSV